MPASLRLAVGAAFAAIVATPAMTQSVAWRLASSHGMASCQMVYDAARDRVVAVGESTSLMQPFATTEWDGTSWRARPLSPAPPARDSFGLAYDAGHSRVVLFGGTLTSGALLDDTWEYDGLLWTARSPAVRPSARRSPAMTWDLARGCVLLAGGAINTSTLVHTWTWNGTNWQNASTPIPALNWVTMASHPSTQRVVLVGNRSSSVAETWTFDGSNWTQATAASTPWGSRYRMTTDSARNRIVLLATDSATPWQWNGTAWTP